MIIFPPQEFITWTNKLMQFPWPIQVGDFAPYAEKLGWAPTSLPDEFSVCAGNNGGRVILGDDRSGNVRVPFLSMARNETEDAEGAAELNDHLWPVWLLGGRRGGSLSCWRPGMGLV